MAGQAMPAEDTTQPATEAPAPVEAPATTEAPAARAPKAPPEPPRLRLNELKPGSQVKGTVKNIAQFGAFVDIGAEQDGLVHISELSENRVRRVEDVVKVGQEVEVTILDVDASRRRISLSMKPRYDVYDRPQEDRDEETLTPMQLAFQRAQQKRDEQQNAKRDRERTRQQQEDILSRTLRQHKDRK